MKQKKWAPIKEILFTYLAINKIMYWFNTINAMEQADLGTASRAVLMRFLNQDLMLIIGVIAFYFLNKKIELKKSKYSKISEYILFYVIGFAILIGIVFVYNVVMTLIFAPENFSLAEFISIFVSFIPSFALGYIVVAVVLEVKIFFKNKGKESSGNEEVPAVQAAEDVID